MIILEEHNAGREINVNYMVKYWARWRFETKNSKVTCRECGRLLTRSDRVRVQP